MVLMQVFYCFVPNTELVDTNETKPKNLHASHGLESLSVWLETSLLFLKFFPLLQSGANINLYALPGCRV